MSASKETADASNGYEETKTGDNNPPNAGAGTMQTHTSDQGEESRETKTVNKRVNQILRRTELVHLQKAHRDSKGDTPELDSVLGLLSEKLDIGIDFENFRGKLKGHVERDLDNKKYVMCVVKKMMNPIKTFEEDNMHKYFDEGESK